MYTVVVNDECALSEITTFPSHLQNGSTPIFVASQNGHIQVVEILLNNGANPNIQKEVLLSSIEVNHCLMEVRY